ncbi:MAG: pseudouridine synthase [Gulosibacter sp.]
MGEWLRDKLPTEVDTAGMLADERFVYEDATPVRETDPYRPNTFVWFYRDLREEPIVPGEVAIVYQDARILVIDKPPFLATTPRGRHVTQTVLVRMRDQLGLPELSPAHRLDRATSGLLVLTTERKWRGVYQSLFQQQRVEKVYRAVAPINTSLELPTVVTNRIEKTRGILQAKIVPGEPNASTRIELETALDARRAIYRLAPATGKTHQLRIHLNSLGIPIENDPLYPEIREDNPEDFTHPLQLLAAELMFTDPVDGALRRFHSQRTLPLTV